MYKVDWSAVATKELLAELRSAAEAQGDVSDEELRPVVAAILRHCGGLPVSEEDWSAADRAAIGRRLLHEALSAFLRRGLGRRSAAPKHELVPTDDARLGALIEERFPVDVNHASASSLEPLPVFGAVLAERTVSERRRGGTFASLEELAERVHGIGAAGAKSLEPWLRFDSAADGTVGPAFTGDLAADLRLVVALAGTSDGSRSKLLSSLEAVLAFVAAEPHPATRAGAIRKDLSPSRKTAPGPDVTADSVSLVEDSAYVPSVRALLEGAQRVDVAMFFISAPGKERDSAEASLPYTPRDLLEPLAAVHKQHGGVRVLVDHDREDDPYLSRIINSHAVGFLRERGVPVRFDAPDVLLHSKFLAIDERVCLIGSHNWTRPSFNEYGDVSAILHSQELTRSLHARFDKLWAEAPEG